MLLCVFGVFFIVFMYVFVFCLCFLMHKWAYEMVMCFVFFFKGEEGIRDGQVTGVQTCALPSGVVITALLETLKVLPSKADVSLPAARTSAALHSPGTTW